MSLFHTPSMEDQIRFARPSVTRLRWTEILATVGAACAMVVGMSVPAFGEVDPSPSPTDPTPVSADPSLSLEDPVPISYWGGGDNTSAYSHLNAQHETVGTVTSVWEVVGYPAVGEAGTVTIWADISWMADNEQAFWHAAHSTRMTVWTEASQSSFSSTIIGPTEHVFTGFYSDVTWRTDRDHAWIQFPVEEDWDREIYVQETGNWYGPDTGKVAPALDDDPDGITVEVLDWEETVFDQTIDYSIEVTVDPVIVGAREDAWYQVMVYPNASPNQVTIPAGGGSAVFTGQITGITDANARPKVYISAVDSWGRYIYELTRRQIDLGYINAPAEVTFSLDQWVEGDAGIWWEATIDTRSLAGAADEVCASEYSTCHATVVAVTDTGRTYTLWGIPISARGNQSTTATNIGGVALPKRDYVAVFARIRGSSAYGVAEILDSNQVSIYNYRPGLGWGGEPVTDWEAWIDWWNSKNTPVIPGKERTYVALGDSFQSGEGTDAFVPSTDSDGTNLCHRSNLAYPARLQAGRVFGDLDFEFWACSGSTIGTLLDSVPSENGPPWDDPRRTVSDLIAYAPENKSALDRLGEETSVVTIGIGGNDVGFARVLNECELKSAEDVAHNKYPNTFWWSDYSCREHFEESVDDLIRLLHDLRLYFTLLFDVRGEAEHAKVYILGYPRFFQESGNGGRCQNIRWTDQLWINSEIRYLNGVIKDEATGMANTQFIDIYDVGAGHELCVGDSSNWFMKGVSITGGSFHPNTRGHALIADAIENQVVVLPSGWTGAIRQGETLNSSLPISFPTLLRGSVSYPGSDVMVTLISPSGEVFNRTTGQANLSIDRGGTWETLEITEPEVGEWTVELYGLEVDPGGEPFEFTSYVRPKPNEGPVAVATLEQHGGIVTVDGSGSFDPDGEIVEIGFDFGDDTVVYGDTATHMYTEPGEVLVTMWVKDDDGDYGFADVGTVIEIPDYEFSGFTRFMSHKPVKDWALAGHPVYLGFQLGQEWGDDIMMPGSPTVQEVSCETGAIIGDPQSAVGLKGMIPRYINLLGEYAWIWDTQDEWAGTCQTLTFDFNEGSTATYTIDFSPPGKGKGVTSKDKDGDDLPFSSGNKGNSSGFWWLFGR